MSSTPTHDSLAAPRRRSRALAFLGAVSALAAAALAAPWVGPAAAVSSLPGVDSPYTTVRYAYVADGESLDVSFALSVVRGAGQDVDLAVTDPAGTVAWTCLIPRGATPGTTCAAPGLTGAAGAWRIDEVHRVSGTNQVGLAWDVTVRGAGTEVPGRVWTEQANMLQSSADPTGADLSLWMVSDAGYVYHTRLGGYHGVGSTLAVDSVGTTATTDSCESRYGSVDYAELTAVGDCTRYRLFYEEPAADLPARADSANGPLTVLPPPLAGAELAVPDLAFAPAASGRGGTFTYTVPTRFSGNYALQIDGDGDGAYDGPADRTVPLAAPGTAEGNRVTVDYDGLDAHGIPVADCAAVRARVHFDKVGEIHVVNSDVEGRPGGIAITRVNGPGAPDSTVYWDDTRLSADGRANVTPVLDGTAGVDSTGGVHGWPYSTTSWGDARAIDDWTYVAVDQSGGEISLPGRCPEDPPVPDEPVTEDPGPPADPAPVPGLVLTKSVETGIGTGRWVGGSTGRGHYRPGDVAQFRITVANTGQVTLTDIVVRDPLAPQCDQTVPVLAPGQRIRYGCSMRITGDVTNVATAASAVGGTVASGATVTTGEPESATQARLPRTGAEPRTWLATATGLLSAGAFLLAGRLRRAR